MLAAAIAFGLPEDPPIEPASDEASHRAPAGTAAATDDASRQGGPEPSPSHASARPDPSPKRAAHTPASGSAVAPDASPSTGPDAAARGHLEIESRPLANVYVDGHAQGTTPFAGELAVGPHEIRMTARGHAPWTETVEVAPEENSPLSVTLKPKRGAAARAEPAPAPAGASDAAPPTPQSKPSPFLPTKRGDKSAVFLPTKDPH